MTSVLQNWVCELPFMQQSVLIAAVRAPDGLRKDHPVKVIMRWYRRCMMVSAFEGEVISNPWTSGGGSFTGPFVGSVEEWDEVRKTYLRYVDEMPHHFQLHMMHAAQIIGYKHDNLFIREWWHDFYNMIVNDAHLFPESEELMSKRLGDNEGNWRAREEVTAL